MRPETALCFTVFTAKLILCLQTLSELFLTQKGSILSLALHIFLADSFNLFINDQQMSWKIFLTNKKLTLWISINILILIQN